VGHVRHTHLQVVRPEASRRICRVIALVPPIIRSEGGNLELAT
jgi:hypothetical protein